jgi:hypothetical protein
MHSILLIYYLSSECLSIGGFRQENGYLIEAKHCLVNMVGQFGALIDTTELTDTVYMVCPTGNQPSVVG